MAASPAAARRGAGQRHADARPRLRRYARRRRSCTSPSARFPPALAHRRARSAPRAPRCSRPISPASRPARASPASAKGGLHQVGFHPTGVVGAFASSLVAGRLMELSPRAPGSARRASRFRSRAATCSSSRTARGPSASIRAGPRPAASPPPRSPRTTSRRRARPTKGASACIAATCRRPSWRACDFSLATARAGQRLGDRQRRGQALPRVPLRARLRRRGDRPASRRRRPRARALDPRAGARGRGQGGVRAGGRKAPAEERLRREIQHSLRRRERPRARPPRPGRVRCPRRSSSRASSG